MCGLLELSKTSVNLAKSMNIKLSYYSLCFLMLRNILCRSYSNWEHRLKPYLLDIMIYYFSEFEVKVEGLQVVFSSVTWFEHYL